jgi:pimeloyl-ACP methyl ester carboxylesterase
VTRRSRVLRGIGLALVVIVACGVVGFLWYAQPQPLLPEATAALASTDRATYDGSGGRITYRPTAGTPTTGLILYPGGKVPSTAYAPPARAIAELGYLVVIVSVPFNLAVFDIGAAAPVIAAHPEIEHWVVGGHSLGGSMAAQFLAGDPGVAEGLVFWAAYAATDLSGQDLAVASIYGSLDTGAASYTSPTAVANAGPDLAFTVIEGGNHEQMGWYTGQPNDPPATITRVDQQAQVVEATRALLDAVGDPVR